jgi:hypothetical protein
MLKTMKKSDTYLAAVHRHRWSRQIMMKIDKILELSASTVAFISRRGRLAKVLAGAARGEMGSRGGVSRVMLSDVDLNPANS